MKDILRNRRDPEGTSNWSDTTCTDTQTCSETQTYSDSNTIIYSYHGSEMGDNEGEANSPPRPETMVQVEERNNYGCSEGGQDVENSSKTWDGSADKSNSMHDRDENQVITHMTEEQFQQFLKYGSRPPGSGNPAYQKRKKKTSIVKKYFQLPHPCAAYDGIMDGRPLLLNSQESILREELASYGRTEDCHIYRAECNLCADKLKYCPRSLMDDLLMHLMLVHKVKGSKVYISKEDEDQMTRLFNNPSYSSVVWNYFILRRNNTMTECMLCGEVLHYPLDMSTASMRTHLTNEHSVILSHAQWDD